MRLAQLLPVIAVIGSSPGVRAVPQGLPIYREGAYHSYVKSSSPTADSSFDARALVQALRDTGHDIVGFICDDGEFGDDESGTFWKAFRDLLDASQDKIEVFAVLRERHLVAASRWDYDWLRAAFELSTLSLEYPGTLKGFTIDDFGGHCHSAESRASGSSPPVWGPELEPSESPHSLEYINNITLAAASANPEFEFWPTVYLRNLGKRIAEGHVIGAPNGVRMQAEESCSVKIHFSLVREPDTLDISFLSTDTHIGYGDPGIREVHQRFLVNGTEVHDELIWDDQYVELFNQDIKPHLVWGGGTTNEVELRIEAPVTGVFPLIDKVLYIWDLQFKKDGAPFTDYTISYDSVALDEDYDVDGVTLNNFHDELLLNESTAPYSMAGLVHGIISPYPDTADYYTPEGFRRLVRSGATPMGEHRMDIVLKGGGWGNTIDPSLFSEQIGIAREEADGVLIWHHQVQVYYMDQNAGIFAERASARDDFELMAFYPDYRPGCEGWYQRFQCEFPLSGGNILVQVRHAELGYDPGEGFFSKRIYLQESGTVLWEEAITGPPVTEDVWVTVPPGEHLVLEMREIDGVAHAPTRLYFRVVPSGMGPLPRKDFSFSSGTDDAGVLQSYIAITEAFK